MRLAPRSAAILVALAALVLGVAPARANPGALNWLASYADAGLGGARDALVVGDNVYVSGQNDNSLVEYTRDPATGLLTNMGCFQDTSSGGGCSAFPGLQSPRYMVVDGNFLYVTAGDSHAISWFARDPGTGALSYEGCVTDSSITVPGCTQLAGTGAALLGAEGITTASAGGPLYVTGQDNGVLMILDVTLRTGEPTFRSCYSNDPSFSPPCTLDAGALDHPRDLTINDAGDSLYVASAQANGIAQFSRDTATGDLAPLTPALVGGVNLPVGIAATPDDAFVYVAGVADSDVAVYSREKATGKLTFLQCVTDVGSGAACGSSGEGLSGAEGVAFSADGANVYAASLFDNAVVKLARGADGRLSWVGCTSQGGSGGCLAGSGLDMSHQLGVSDDSRFVYVPSGTDNSVSVFSCYGAEGTFDTTSSPLGCIENLAPGLPTCPVLPGALSEGPVGFIDDGTHMFVTDNCDQTTYRFPEGSDTPDLTVNNGLDEGLALAGGHYYGLATGAGPGPTGLYELDPGTLAVGSPIVPINDPRAIAVDPVSGDLFITNDSGGAGSEITRVHDPSGTPQVSTFVAPSGQTFSGLAFNSDGSILYVARAADVAAYNRSGTQLGFAPSIPDGPEGVVVAPPSTMVGGVDVSNNVFTNNEGTAVDTGTISRIDVNAGDAVSTVAQNGTRGDLFGVDAQGFMVSSQTDRLVRIAPAIFPLPSGPAVVPPVSAVFGPPGAAPPGATPPGVPRPIALRTGNLRRLEGVVFVRLPGAKRPVRIETLTSIPVGTLIDTRHGVAELTTAEDLRSPRLQVGVFSRGLFYFNQAVETLTSFGTDRVWRGLVTELRMVGGGSVKSCPVGSAGRLPAGPRGTAARKRFVRYLEAKAHGRFRVIGRESSSLERGTDWLTRDDCTGTLTKVKAGSVVVTDFAKHKDLLVKLRHQYLANGRTR